MHIERVLCETLNVPSQKSESKKVGSKVKNNLFLQKWHRIMGIDQLTFVNSCSQLGRWAFSLYVFSRISMGSTLCENDPHTDYNIQAEHQLSMQNFNVLQN